MAEIPATEFKAKCLELMDRVAEHRESFVITKRGKAVAKLVPLARKPKDSIFGWLRGQASEVGDILGPAVSPQAWDVLREWDDLSAAERGRAGARRKGTRRRRR